MRIRGARERLVDARHLVSGRQRRDLGEQLGRGRDAGQPAAARGAAAQRGAALGRAAAAPAAAGATRDMAAPDAGRGNGGELRVGGR